MKGPQCPDVGRNIKEKTSETTEKTMMTEEKPTNKNLKKLNYVLGHILHPY